MKICKVKPDNNTCCACIDIQIDCGVIEDCSKCPDNITDYELLAVGSTIFGKGFAFIVKDGKIERVPIKRIYDVRNIGDETWAVRQFKQRYSKPKGE